MKIVKIILISIVALAALAFAGLAIFIANFDVNRYKPQIVSQAKSALERDVNFDNISLALSLTKGVKLNVSNAVIGEGQEFGTGNFLEIKNLSLGVDIWGYIFRKQVNISDIVIDTPRLKVIRTKDGRINAASVGGKPSSVPAAADRRVSPALAVSALPDVNISSIKIINAAVNYEDRSFDPALSLDVTELGVQFSRISLVSPFPFMIEGRVVSEKKNFRIDGNIRVNLGTGAITVSGLKCSSDLADLLLEKIPVVFPQAKGMVLPSVLKGSLQADLDNITFGAKGLSGLSGNAVLAGGMLGFKELGSPIKDIELKSKLSATSLSLEDASAHIGNGSLKASGLLQNYLTTQNYDLSVNIADLKIQDLLPQEKTQVKAEGVIAGSLKVKGAGFSPDALKTALGGDGNISAKSVVLKDINILRTVLDKISIIPNLSEKIQANLPDKYKEKLNQNDTRFSDISLPLSIQNGRIIFKEAKIGADEFIFEGEVDAGFDGTYSATGSFLIPAELSAAMVSAVPQLEYLLNQEKQIYIPLKVAGKAPGVNIAVDLEYLGKKLIVNQVQTQIQDQLGNILGKILKVKEAGQ